MQPKQLRSLERKWTWVRNGMSVSRSPHGNSLVPHVKRRLPEVFADLNPDLTIRSCIPDIGFVSGVPPPLFSVFVPSPPPSSFRGPRPPPPPPLLMPLLSLFSFSLADIPPSPLSLFPFSARSPLDRPLADGADFAAPPPTRNRRYTLRAARNTYIPYSVGEDSFLSPTLTKRWLEGAKDPFDRLGDQGIRKRWERSLYRRREQEKDSETPLFVCGRGRLSTSNAEERI